MISGWDEDSLLLEIAGLDARARHPARWQGVVSGVVCQLSSSMSVVGDMALDSCAQFLAVAEHRLIPARARSIGHQPRKADRQSVWACAGQDQLSGGHTGVGVISLSGAPLSAPSLVTLSFGSSSSEVGP